MASIYLRKKKWWISYYVDGKLRQHSLKVTDKKRALHLKKLKEIEIEQGTAKLPSTKRVDEFFEEYKEYSKANKNISTYKGELGNLTAFVNYCSPYIKDITPGTIQKFLISISSYCNVVTRNNYLKHIKTFLNYAMQCQYIFQNPANSVKKFKEEKRIPRFLNDEEIERLIEAADGNHLYPMIITALYTGMRIGELINLKWQNINLKDNIITLPSSMVKNKKFRIIPLNNGLKGILTASKNGSQFCFTYKGKPYVQPPQRAFRGIIKRAGIKNAGWHTLRKTFASHLVMKGISLYKVSKWLGHSDPKLTADVYAHLVPRTDEDIERLEF